jgi:SAM-dependent methyltransferase
MAAPSRDLGSVILVSTALEKNRPDCPHCGHPTSYLFSARDRNQSVNDRSFPYRRCEQCGLIFLTEAPPDISEYYPDAYHELPPPARLPVLAADESYRIELVQRHVGGGRLVEIGAGFGIFAYQAKEAGFDVAAIEMDPRCCEYLRTVVGVEVVESDRPEDVLPLLPKSRSIALWHVLEHLSEPWRCLESAAENLESGGVLVIAMPNPAALQFRILRSRWPHVDAPRHRYLIPTHLLRSRLDELGLDCVELTTTDPGGLHWNRFGWQRALRGFGSGKLVAGFALVAGALIAALLSPVERRGLNGATYTAVFHKRGV